MAFLENSPSNDTASATESVANTASNTDSINYESKNDEIINADSNCSSLNSSVEREPKEKVERKSNRPTDSASNGNGETRSNEPDESDSEMMSLPPSQPNGDGGDSKRKLIKIEHPSNVISCRNGKGDGDEPRHDNDPIKPIPIKDGESAKIKASEQGKYGKENAKNTNKNQGDSPAPVTNVKKAKHGNSRSKTGRDSKTGRFAKSASNRSNGKRRILTSSTKNSNLHQEYNVDHSCSTPLERLARDIGNALRKWNVNGGCDRHVSLDWGEIMDSEVGDGEPEMANVEKTQQPRPQSQCFSDPTTASVATPDSATTKRLSHSRGAQCIRSTKIQFQTIGYSPSSDGETSETSWNRRRYSIPLVLSLWDVPRTPKMTQVGCLDGTNQHFEESHDLNHIPLSLRPMPSLSSFSLLGELGIQPSPGEVVNTTSDNDTPSQFDRFSGNRVILTDSPSPLESGLGQDLCSLFNIGQHISLSLDLDHAITQNDQTQQQHHQNKQHQDDIQSYFSDMLTYTMNHISEAQDRERKSLRERKERWKQHKKIIRKKEQRERKRISQSIDQMKNDNRQSDSQNSWEEGESENKKVSGSNDPIVAVDSNSVSFEFDDDSENEVVFEDALDENVNPSARDEYESMDEGNSTDYEDEDSDSDSEASSTKEPIHLRIYQNEIKMEVMASLSSILQTALNFAACENDCRLPVFGLWGSYHGGNRLLSQLGESKQVPMAENWRCAAPCWISAGLSPYFESVDNDNWRSDDDTSVGQFLLSSPSISGLCQSGAFRSTHRVYSISNKSLPTHLSTLHGLACVLLGQCPSSTGGTAAVTAARHFYEWQRNENLRNNHGVEQSWRKAGSFGDVDPAMLKVEIYREQCRRQALSILERASSQWAYRSVPMWGPCEGNPLLSLSASVSFGLISFDRPNKAPPLLNLPLKIRSANFVPSPAELIDMEQALQSVAFNPVGTGNENNNDPNEPIFFASARFDNECPCASLSANTRCVLAALLRCGSLGLDALPGHLTNKEVLSKLGQTQNALDDVMRLADLGPVTARLVDAMSWSDLEVSSSCVELDRGIAESLQQVGTGAYPEPPVELFAIDEPEKCVHIVSSPHQSKTKASPPGRLLSILFAHMARLRSPPSMMSLWLSFVQELRTRWDSNESLPNLGHVPGLDDDGKTNDHQPHWGLQKADHRVLGHRALYAAFVNSSEPDPDRNHCIINQKLQVFNICIESKMSIEALHEKRMQYNNSEAKTDEMSVGASSDEQTSDGDEFFDPEDEDIDRTESSTRDDSYIENMLKIEAAALSVGHNRVGARCPVPNALITSGDQLYAPYLQRTMPMTDEEEEKQKKLLGVSKSGDKDKSVSIKSRIAISQRLQKQKLLSDMRAFQAANLGAVFEDFILWYGNPENPLNEEINGETARKAFESRSRLPPEEAKKLALEEASEAIQILMSLRTFWSDTWEEAEPLPAFEQEPLFDPYSLVEMVLHSFETIHPALLMNQALATNFSNALFVLGAAAKPARCVRSIELAWGRLQTAVNGALEMLTKDAANGFLHHTQSCSTNDNAEPLVYVSILTAKRCEDACNSMGEMEILLSRALCLLENLPGQYNLVDDLLQCKGNDFVLVKQPHQRKSFLNSIKCQTTTSSKSHTDASYFPEAVLREYVIHNGNIINPCQLSARFVRGGRYCDSSIYGSLLLALTKCSQE